MKRRLAWLAMIALVPLAIAGWFRLRIESDILASLPQGLPEVQALRTLRDAFDGGSDLLIAVQGPDAERAQAAAQAIGQALRNDTARVHEVRGGRPPEAEFGDGAATIAWAMQQADTQKISAWQSSLAGDGAAHKARRALEKLGTAIDGESIPRLAYDPLGLLDTLALGDAEELQSLIPTLQSTDGTLRVLVVTPAQPIDNYRTAAAWLDDIKRDVAAVIADKDITLRYTGEPAFQAEIGGGVAADMSSTIGFTEIAIALLFWIMFRLLRPLLWIQLLLMLSLGIALGIGGLLVGKISAMSLGFAAIVLGIITDYAVLIIQEAREHPAADAATLRKLAAPGMLAGGASTATVFLSLLLSGLPGLMELGLLVALGVLTGLAVMLGCAPYFAARMPKPVGKSKSAKRAPNGNLAAAATFAFILAIAGVFAWRGMPVLSTDADALRPSHSEALDVWRLVQEALGKDHEAGIPLLLSGDVENLRARGQALDAMLQQAKRDGVIVRGGVPVFLLPDAQAQSANRTILGHLLDDQARLEKVIGDAGFSDDAIVLLRGVCEAMRKDFTHDAPLLARHAQAAPALGKLLAADASGRPVAMASASVSGTPDRPDPAKLAALQLRVQAASGATIAGWETLGAALSKQVTKDLYRQLLPILTIILITLWLTFRNKRDVMLSLVLLIAGLMAMAASFAAFGIAWNLASLAAIPLLLGTGIEYGIHLLLALKRHDNDIAHVRSTTGRAVFFSGMTTVIGFASLFFAGNRGVASLGMACCVGTLWLLFILLGLLPHWRGWLHAGKNRAPSAH